MGLGGTVYRALVETRALRNGNRIGLRGILHIRMVLVDSFSKTCKVKFRVFRGQGPTG